jgi:hypothetical protein
MDALAALQELVGKYPEDWAFQIAEAYARRGEPDNTFRWLQTAYNQRDTALPLIRTHTCCNNVRGDPRYQQFLQKMKLPQQPAPVLFAGRCAPG